MKEKIKILLLEDFTPDVEIVREELDSSDINYTLYVSDNFEEYKELLRKLHPDIILSDYYLTGFTGSDALEIRNALAPHVPFILITGSISEEVAVSCMKRGADDYILKNHVKRLPYAVADALKISSVRAEKDNALRQVFESEKKFRFLAERAHDLVYRYVIHPKRYFDFVSPSATSITGYSPDEHYADPDLGKKIVHPDDRYLLDELSTGNLLSEPVIIRWIHKNGSVFWVEQNMTGIYDKSGRLIAIEGTARDISVRKAYEMKLEESERAYRYLFDQSPNVKLIYDDETNGILAVNEAAISTYGYTREEFLKMNLRDLYNKNDYRFPETKIEFDSALYRKSEYCRHKKKDGSEIFVNTDSHEIEFQKKKAWLVFVEDVTEKKKTEERLTLLSSVVEQSSVSILITDSQGMIEYVNSKFLSQSGYDQADLQQKSILSPKPDNHGNELYKKLWETIKNGNIWQGELKNRKKNGELYWESSVISPIKDLKGNITHFVVMSEDITEKKRMLRELIEAKEKAEEASKLKSNFLANMSHELRTPMIGLLGYSELIAEMITDDGLKTLALRMNKSGHRLMETLNLILDLSRLESEKAFIELKKFDAVQMVKEAAADFKATADSKGVPIIFEADVPQILVYTDERMLRSVIHNLISNAIKFTSEGEVVIKLGSKFEKKKNKNAVVISVKDTGIGIPKQQQDIIFQEFRQASEGYSRTYEGTGLGLSLANKFTEKLGGTISVKSTPGEGSEFAVRFEFDAGDLQYAESIQ